MTRVLLTGPGDLAGLGVADPGALRDELMQAARRWAGEVPVVAGPEVPEAVRSAFAAGEDAVVVASVGAPRLASGHARMALADLEDGAEATFGPGMSGGWYLVGLRAPHDAVLSLLGDAGRRDLMARLLAAGAEAGLEVGLLRMERLLRTSRDVAALRADPLTPAPVRAALRPARPG